MPAPATRPDIERSERATQRAVKTPVTGLSNKTTSLPRTLRRLLEIFDAIARVPEDLSLADLSALVKSPKGSLLTLLRPLSSDGYLIHKNSRYNLGREIFALANTILSARKLNALMRALMQEVRLHSNETVILATLDAENESVTDVDVLESNQLIRYSVSAGATRPLHTSAAGQLLLAYQDGRWSDRYLKTAKLERLVEKTFTGVKTLRQKLEPIRKEGFRSAFRGSRRRHRSCGTDFGADVRAIAALLGRGSVGSPKQDALDPLAGQAGLR